MAWLEATCWKTRLDPHCVGNQLARQLGVVTPDNAAATGTLCGCGQNAPYCTAPLDHLGHHVHSCTRAGLCTHRHHFVKNDLSCILQEAGLSTYQDSVRCWRVDANGVVNPKGLSMDIVVEGFEGVGVPHPILSTDPNTPPEGLAHRRHRGFNCVVEQPTRPVAAFFIHHVTSPTTVVSEKRYVSPAWL